MHSHPCCAAGISSLGQSKLATCAHCICCKICQVADSAAQATPAGCSGNRASAPIANKGATYGLHQDSFRTEGAPAAPFLKARNASAAQSVRAGMACNPGVLQHLLQGQSLPGVPHQKLRTERKSSAISASSHGIAPAMQVSLTIALA